MPDLGELYQELILDHSKRPRNRRVMPDANRRAEGYNPLCGDHVHVFVRLENGRVAEAAFQGIGCSICTASASLMTDSVKGKTEAEVDELFGKFHAMVTGTDDGAPPGLGKLEVLSGVKEYPVRVKCATLAWHTLHAALHEADDKVSTE